MKVLLLTRAIPYPPTSGPKVKTWNVLKYLARHHEVTLVSFRRGDRSAQIEHLKAYCHAVYTLPMVRSPFHQAMRMGEYLLTGRPWTVARDDLPAMRALVDHLAQETSFDVVHTDQLSMAQYALRVPGVRKVLDTHNALWLLRQQLYDRARPGIHKWRSGREWRLLKAYEGQVCRQFDAVVAVSEEDKAALLEATGEATSITVIPIAIDIDEVTPVERLPDADHILHIGTMFWPKNIDSVLWFLNEAMPLIRDSQPDAVFDIVGANPPPEIIAFEEKIKGVNVTGYVENPQPYFEHAGVMVVPMRTSSGMSAKTLNALAQGLPLVSTTIGCEGIAVEHGKHLLVADTGESFAQATLLLLNDRDLADELGRNGRELVESTYDYRAACQALEQVYT